MPEALCLVFMTNSSTREQHQANREKKAIEKYISEKGWSASMTESGIYCIMDEEGTGANPGTTSSVTVSYKGYLLDNGTVFDESPVTGITFSLSQVIRGWKEGIPLFRQGGRGKLIIPSRLAYGRHQNGRIPPNSVLVFEVTLVDVL
jgi:FKBP-type peptidyl-prolyl cis-trans isomerase FkpA